MFAEELERGGSAGVATNVSVHSEMALPPIWRFGTEDQKRRFLAPGIRGERIAALGITEPEAGSDVAAIATRAERVEGGYVVNGAKCFIGNGVRADFVVCAVRTAEEGGHKGLSLVVVERGGGLDARGLLHVPRRRICLLLSEQDPERFERAALWSLARHALERKAASGPRRSGKRCRGHAKFGVASAETAGERPVSSRTARR